MFSFKNIVGIVISTLIIVGCQGGASEPTSQTCAELKKGTFKYEGSEDIRIERTDEFQIEYNLSGDGGYTYTDKYNIVWTSDCEYYLTLDSTDHADDLDFSTTDTMWTKIVSVNRNGYSFIAIKGKQTFNGKLKKTDS